MTKYLENILYSDIGDWMKKLLIPIIILFLISLFFFKDGKDTDKNNRKKDELRGVFVSYIELEKYIKSPSVKISKENIEMMINNVKNMGFNTIILQVRSFTDTIYKSNIFPWSKYISQKEGVSPGFDVLDYFIKIGKKSNIKIIAWINPYRVSNSSDISLISESSPIHKLDDSSIYINNGIFLNPSSKEVNKLILDGIEEIVKNYEVESVLFDDYFYPNKNIDIDFYSKYIKENKYISIDDYHLMIVSNLVSSAYDVCHKYDKNFGISPDGNIENNYNKHYADVKLWGKSDEYVDYLMPQIYYGFFNESKAFTSVIDEWSSLISNDKIKLIPAFAFYKVGLKDPYAKSGEDEWINNSDIIMREIILSRNINNYQGFTLFRYGNIFDNKLYTVNTLKEIENMKKVLK